MQNRANFRVSLKAELDRIDSRFSDENLAPITAFFYRMENQSIKSENCCNFEENLYQQLFKISQLQFSFVENFL